MDYPLQFCGHHWGENEKSAERGLSQIYCLYNCSVKKSQQPDGKNKSFQYLKSMIHDPLLLAKLKYFEMVSSKLNPFLRGFQTNKPMEIKSNLYNLIQINPLDRKIRKNPESVDIGFAAKHKLEKIKSSFNSAKILEFKKQGGDFLGQLLHHVLEKSTLKYAVVRSTVSNHMNFSELSPEHMKISNELI